jgi:alanine dehydrogenase
LHAGATDAAYEAAGATILADGPAVFAAAEMIVKVKEPMHSELVALRPDHILVANLYCGRDRALVDHLLATGTTAIAAEHAHPHHPGNSPIAGELGALEGLRLLFRPHGGNGRHFMRHAGAPGARAVVIGLGLAGRGVLRVLLNLGVAAIGIDEDPAASARAATEWSNRDFAIAPVAALPGLLGQTDLVINCVRWDKNRRDHLVTREMLGLLPRGAVIVDVACDRAGAIETSVPTSWENPTYQVAGITHFCVENLPAAVPPAASATFAEVIAGIAGPIAANGLAAAARDLPWLGAAVVCRGGRLHDRRTALLQGRDWLPPDFG